MIEQLRQEIEGANLRDEDKHNALIDVEQMAAENRRSQPRLERIKDSVASISQIVTTSTPAISAILACLKTLGVS